MTYNIHESAYSKNAINHIISLANSLTLIPNPNLKPILLSIGDPTAFGNYLAPDITSGTVSSLTRSGLYNGYPDHVGSTEARDAVAELTNVDTVTSIRSSISNASTIDECKLITGSDVIITCSCASALELCITVLVDSGKTVLAPRPGFSVYSMYAKTRGADVKLYNLLPERSWEADLVHLESLIDSTTAAIIVNNPSNPGGSNYSPDHLRAIIAIAEKNFIPIIADEVYAGMAFPESPHPFTPLASVSDSVPVLSCSGLSKRFMLPGWRIGWITVHDRCRVLAQEVVPGLIKLSEIILGPCSLLQATLPKLLKAPSSYHIRNVAKLQSSANLSMKLLSVIPGLEPIRPWAAMYIMIRIDLKRFPHFDNEIAFVESLVAEQSVYCLPGSCFDIRGYIRVTLVPPDDILQEAFARLDAFCKKYVIPEKREILYL